MLFGGIKRGEESRGERREDGPRKEDNGERR